MLTDILLVIKDILEVMVIAIGIFLLEKYVFLEPQMEEKNQRIFYLISILFIITIFLFAGKDAATMAAIISGGLNVSFGRKKGRIKGFFLIIPLIGIINGIVVPFMVMPPSLMNFTGNHTLMWTFFIYGLLAISLLIFYYKGKEWRKWFNEKMQKRHLNHWEKFLLCLVGIMMLCFSRAVPAQIDDIDDIFKIEKILERLTINNVWLYRTKSYVILFGLTGFVLTVIIIALIMQGNKRSFYYKQVSDMQFNTIALMADIVENRDENTGGHIKRTAKYVEIIARHLKEENAFPDILTEQYIYDMTVAAPLHDIGKIHISDVILNKPGKFTDEEFEIMKGHTLAGRDLLRQAKEQLGEFTYLNIAENMAAYHHEWWNGKGYPEGIKEDEIPLCARIMAVADVFDAISSKRCYKEAMPLEKAYDIISKEAGTHFDPVVAEAFLDSRKEIEKAFEEYSS